jgi:hypothetical protein
MNTIKVTRTILGTRYAVKVDGRTVKSHRSHEAASWHLFALNCQTSQVRAITAQTRATHDAQWAGRC